MNSSIKRLIAEWLWRAALICALGWIGWELHEIRLEMQQPAEDQTTAEAESDPLQESLDALRDDGPRPPTLPSRNSGRRRPVLVRRTGTIRVIWPVLLPRKQLIEESVGHGVRVVADVNAT